jgi:intracellular sulfur oxidation DsrE/DsrF family protein
MSQEKRFSDEFLNAFVDNQIAAEEKSRAYIEIGQDENLNRQVCELRKLHDLVQLAYQNPPTSPLRQHGTERTRRARMRFGVAASFLLILGVLFGTQTKLLLTTNAPETVSATPIEMPQAAPVSPPKQATLATPVNSAAVMPVDRVADGKPSNNKVLIHIAYDDALRLSQSLDEVESLLRYYRDSRQDARVEVVINGKGLELVRVDTSAFANRIQDLQKEFDNLTFAACQNTIDRLKRERGILVRLLPGVIVIDSGMAELMRRQNQGWTYLRV